jgi:hypothetical protein
MNREKEKLEIYKQNRRIVRRVLLQCEATGKFTPSSRRYFEVGELELAAEGIYRFIFGNTEFKNRIDESDLQAVIALVDDPSPLKPLKW